MANKWINHVKKYAAEHNMKYMDCLKSAECKSSYKSGSGMVDDVKKMAVSGAKKLLKKGIDAGADKLKEVVGEGVKKRRGKGILGNVLKTVGNAALDMAPVPNVVRDVGKHIGNYAVDKSGLGIIKRKTGKALYP